MSTYATYKLINQIQSPDGTWSSDAEKQALEITIDETAKTAPKEICNLLADNKIIEESNLRTTDVKIGVDLIFVDEKKTRKPLAKLERIHPIR